MENVHGISVSGGSFPAEIWRRFMDPALAGLPPRDFPSPTQTVSFRSWQRGPSALSYDPYYVAPAAPAPTTTEEAPPPKPKPADTAPAAKGSVTSTPPAAAAATGSGAAASPATNGGRPAEP
jgi:membrane peptidoglycan carboxypeptidase